MYILSKDRYHHKQMHRQLNVKQIQLGGKDGGELVLGRGKAERERKRERIQKLWTKMIWLEVDQDGWS